MWGVSNGALHVGGQQWDSACANRSAAHGRAMERCMWGVSNGALHVGVQQWASACANRSAAHGAAAMGLLAPTGVLHIGKGLRTSACTRWSTARGVVLRASSCACDKRHRARAPSAAGPGSWRLPRLQRMPTLLKSNPRTQCEPFPAFRPSTHLSAAPTGGVSTAAQSTSATSRSTPSCLVTQPSSELEGRLLRTP